MYINAYFYLFLTYDNYLLSMIASVLYNDDDDDDNEALSTYRGDNLDIRLRIYR